MSICQWANSIHIGGHENKILEKTAVKFSQVKASIWAIIKPSINQITYLVARQSLWSSCVGLRRRRRRMRRPGRRPRGKARRRLTRSRRRLTSARWRLVRARRRLTRSCRQLAIIQIQLYFKFKFKVVSLWQILE